MHQEWELITQAGLSLLSLPFTEAHTLSQCQAARTVAEL